MFTRSALLRFRFCALRLVISAAAQPAISRQRTTGIDFLNFSPRIKRISAAQKEQLMGSGTEGAQAFFNK